MPAGLLDVFDVVPDVTPWCLVGVPSLVRMSSGSAYRALLPAMVGWPVVRHVALCCLPVMVVQFGVYPCDVAHECSPPPGLTLSPRQRIGDIAGSSYYMAPGNTGSVALLCGRVHSSGGVFIVVQCEVQLSNIAAIVG